MDIEQDLRASLVAPDPGAEFTAAVIARMGRHATGRRRSIAGSSGWGRRRNRFIMVGVVVVGAAAAMLALWVNAGRPQPAITQVVTPAASVEEHAAPSAAAPAGVPSAQQPDAGRVSGSEPEAVVSPAASPPPKEESVHYTVVATLRHETADAEARVVAETFFGFVLNELRKVPGLTLRVWDAADPAPAQAGEYDLKVVSLATTLAANGSVSWRAGTSQGSFRIPGLGNPVLVDWTVHWGGSPTRAPLYRTTPLYLARDGAPRPAICSQPDIPEMGTGNLCRTAAELALMEVTRLRANTFPPDSGLMQMFAAQMSDRALAAPNRVEALNKLLLAKRRKLPPQLDSGSAAAIVRLIADLPSSRATVWRLVRSTAHPDLVSPLLVSLDSSGDESIRLEALNTLVTDYASDPRVRRALEVVASDEPNEFLRALARYPVSGLAGWLGYVRQTVKNERLTTAERLRPLVFTSDEAQGDFRKTGLAAMAGDVEIADAVLAIARANPPPAMVDLTSVADVGTITIRRALYALTVTEAGPIEPGSRRQELQALNLELNGRINSMIQRMRQLGQEQAGTPAPQLPPQ